jgi:hypothetical protein
MVQQKHETGLVVLAKRPPFRSMFINTIQQTTPPICQHVYVMQAKDTTKCG